MSWFDFQNFHTSLLFRKKHFTSASVESTRLERCLGLIELTTLGIGTTLGAGIYVVTPDSIREFAGPAMCISFVIAAIASVLSGMCYAELGARIPRAGSAYAYSYVAVGEIWAFVVGWNMILEYVIGTASVARAAVTYVDVLANDFFQDTFRRLFPLNVSFLGEYVDPVAFAVTLLLSVLLAVGVSESAFINNMLVMINCGVLVYIIIIGFVYADPANWQLTPEQLNGTDHGAGGFMPYGFSGVMTAASAAFYSFVGFDCIATTGEEVTNPRRNIPLSIVLSLTVCTVAYVLVSIVFTLDTPYYEVTQKTLLPAVPFGKYVVSIGAIVCASTSLLGGMFPLPRIIYSMAEDGLLFSFLAKVSRRFKTPVLATILSGLLTAVFAAVFDVAQLVDMLSIGTLMAYSCVAASVLALRYRQTFHDTIELLDSEEEDDEDEEQQYLLATGQYLTHPSFIKAVFDLTKASNPPRATHFTSSIAVVVSSILAVFLFICTLFVTYLVRHDDDIQVWTICVICVSFVCAAFFAVRLWSLPQNTQFRSFQVPFAPSTPVIALFVNFYLLTSLNGETWVRFGIWMFAGLIIYFCYSLWASKERLRALRHAGHHSYHQHNNHTAEDDCIGEARVTSPPNYAATSAVSPEDQASRNRKQ